MSLSTLITNIKSKDTLQIPSEGFENKLLTGLFTDLLQVSVLSLSDLTNAKENTSTTNDYTVYTLTNGKINLFGQELDFESFSLLQKDGENTIDVIFQLSLNDISNTIPYATNALNELVPTSGISFIFSSIGTNDEPITDVIQGKSIVEGINISIDSEVSNSSGLFYDCLQVVQEIPGFPKIDLHLNGEMQFTPDSGLYEGPSQANLTVTIANNQDSGKFNLGYFKVGAPKFTITSQKVTTDDNFSYNKIVNSFELDLYQENSDVQIASISTEISKRMTFWSFYIKIGSAKVIPATNGGRLSTFNALFPTDSNPGTALNNIPFLSKALNTIENYAQFDGLLITMLMGKSPKILSVKGGIGLNQTTIAAHPLTLLDEIELDVLSLKWNILFQENLTTKFLSLDAVASFKSLKSIGSFEIKIDSDGNASAVLSNISLNDLLDEIGISLPNGYFGADIEISTLSLNRYSDGSLGLSCYMSADFTLFGQTNALQVSSAQFDFQRSAGDKPEWSGSFSAQTPSGKQMNLTNLANKIVSEVGIEIPSAAPSVMIENLKVSYDSTSKDFSFSGESVLPGKIPLGDAIHDIDITADMTVGPNPDTGKREFTGVMQGTLKIGEADFTLKYSMGKDNHVFDANWDGSATNTTLTISSVLSAFGIDDPLKIPNDLNPDITIVSFEYNMGDKKLALAAHSSKYGDAFLTADKGDNGWIVVFGLCLPNLNSPGIPAVFQKANILDMSSLTILVSSGQVKDFSLPNLPALNASSASDNNSKNNPFSLGDKPIQIQGEGVVLAATWNLGSSTGSHPVLSNLHSLVNQSTLSVLLEVVNQSAEGGASDVFQVTADLGGSLKIPAGGSSDMALNDCDVTLQFEPEFEVKLSGSITFHLDGKLITTVVGLVIDETEADVLVDIDCAPPNGLPAPPMLKGVHFEQAGLEVGVFFEPPGLDIGVTGKLKIVDENPRNATSDLVDFGFILEIIEEVPDPLYIAFNADTIDISEAYAAFSGNSSSIPEVLNDVKLLNVAFYWCDDLVVLPDGTTAMPGFGFHGILDIFGFQIFGSFTSNTQGIKGKVELDPVHLKIESVPVFSLTGDGKGISIKEEKQPNGSWERVSNSQVKKLKGKNAPQIRNTNVVQSGGAVCDFSSSGPTFLHASAHASLLGMLNVSVNMTIAEKGMSFDFKRSAAKITGMEFSCSMTYGTSYSFTAAGNFYFHLNGSVGPIIPGLSFTKIHLDVGLNGNLSLTVGETFALKVGGSFEFEGINLTLPEFTLTVPLGHIDELADHIWDQIKNEAETIFKDFIDEGKQLLKDAEKAAEAIGKGAEEAAEAIGKGAEEAANEIAKGAEDVAKATEQDAEAVANTAKQVGETAAKVTEAAVQKVSQIGEEAEQEASKLANEGATVLSDATHKVGQIAAAAEQDVEQVGHEIANVASDAATEVSNIANEAAHEVTQVIGDARQEAVNILNGAKQAVDAIGRETEQVLGEAEHLAEEAAEAAKRAAEEAAEEAKRLAEQAAEEAKKVAEAAAHEVSHVAHSVWHAISHY